MIQATPEGRHLIAAVIAALALLLPGAARAEHYEELVPLSMRDCTEHVGSFLVPRESVARHMAPGFRFDYFPAGLAGLDPGRRKANVILISIRCATRTVAGLPTPPAPDFIAIVVVEPPAALARSGADFHAIGVYSVIDRGHVRFRQAVLGPDAAAGPLGAVRLGADAIRHENARVKLHTAGTGRVDAAANVWRLFRTHERQVVDAAEVDASPAIDTDPGTALLRSRGVPGLPKTALGIGIHEWGLDVDVTPLELTGGTRCPGPAHARSTATITPGCSRAASPRGH